MKRILSTRTFRRWLRKTEWIASDLLGCSEKNLLKAIDQGELEEITP